jgi:hypothetical protein
LSDYDSIRAVNWSTLKAMRTSPRHYKAAVDTERPDTDALRMGRATHTAVFEPDRMPLDYAVFAENIDKRTKTGKAVWQAFLDVNAGKTILSLAEYTNACRIRDAVRSHPLVKPLLEDGKAEQTLTWTDRTTGIPCKGRLDWACFNAASPLVLDLKTSRYATDERAFASAAYRLGYFGQMAHYVDGVCTINGIAPLSIPAIVVAVESAPPYDVTVYELTEDALWAADEERKELLATLARCLEKDEWPGKHTSRVQLDMPAWSMPDVEDMDVGDEPNWMKEAG